MLKIIRIKEANNSPLFSKKIINMHYMYFFSDNNDIIIQKRRYYEDNYFSIKGNEY